MISALNSFKWYLITIIGLIILNISFDECLPKYIIIKLFVLIFIVVPIVKFCRQAVKTRIETRYGFDFSNTIINRRFRFGRRPS